MGKSFKMSVEEAKATLIAGGYSISGENRNGNNLATVLNLTNGCIINCVDGIKVNLQGKFTSEVEEVLCKPATKYKINKKVFVVYGHDTNARTQLEAMLRRWDLEPLILDQLVSSGQTIIEKLEEYTSQANFGIVLDGVVNK